MNTASNQENEIMEEHATRKSESLLKLSYSDAQSVLLEGSSYCTIDLPPYITFDKLINDVHEQVGNKTLSQVFSRKCCDPKNIENVNYKILINKDGKYSWRSLQLIHPVLYVLLVHQITKEKNWQFICKRFGELYANKQIRCLSMPVKSFSNRSNKAELITYWWHEVEQESLELSLEYNYLLRTDITDCYGAIYTHSIAWAIHGKREAKSTRRSGIGNEIDKHIQHMCYGQTNGIPEGSILMDFIAEMVLGYADLELSKRIEESEIKNYRILRYRDDYRIFVNSPECGGQIIKFLTDVMISLGLKLNPSKTTTSDDVVRTSIKADKLAWMIREKNIDKEMSLQKHLMVIHDHAYRYPNSGSIIRALINYRRRLPNPPNNPYQLIFISPHPLIAITADIAYRNPRAHPICCAILSNLLMHIPSYSERQETVRKINQKFDGIPHTGCLQVWLQRVSCHIDNNFLYDESLCKLVQIMAEKILGEERIELDSITIWNNDWVTPKSLLNILDPLKIVDEAELENSMKSIISDEEVSLYGLFYGYSD